MWERVKTLSSTNNDAVRVTLSTDSKEISEKMKQSQDTDQTIDQEQLENNPDANENDLNELSVDHDSDDTVTVNNIKIDKESDKNDKKSESTEMKEDKTQTNENDDKNQKSENQLEKAEKENKDLQDRLLRLSAEFENFKKRNRREMSEFKKFASEVLIKDLLPVVDNLDRALETASADEACKAIKEGVSMTRDEMLKVFSKYGVKPIEALEKDFDPAFHQAVGQEENNEHPKNVVLKEYQKGYTIHGRLLRPSMVVVSN
jgi:molecular chaperone GrpE